jgi:K+:H+ antiporter
LTCQAFIIIVTCRILHWPLSKIRQPRVIAEVIGTPPSQLADLSRRHPPWPIVSDPVVYTNFSIMGRIPNFTNTIFPTAALPNLTLVANLGLVFFLFIVGLEVDVRLMLRNARIALGVSTLGIILPFSLGSAIAVGIYNNFAAGPAQPSFGIFMLFMGVSFSITAFPVLARILTELKLLQTAVGVITLSAGVGNDVVGWILLALTVTLVHAGNGITVLYVILCSLGIVLFLVFFVRPVFIYVAKRHNGLQSGPSEMMMAVIILLILASSFYTDIIGVHAIFGGFLVGLIIPHEHGYAVRVTEKLEDFISALFLPLVQFTWILLTSVLRVVWTAHKYRIIGQRNYMGIYDRSDRSCARVQDHRKYPRRALERHGLARIFHDRRTNEL